jgi:hypothetical protein
MAGAAHTLQGFCCGLRRRLRRLGENGPGVCPAQVPSIRRSRRICGHIDKTLFARNIGAIDSNEEDMIFVVDPELGALGKIDVQTERSDGAFQGVVNFKSFNGFKRAGAICMRPDGIINYSRFNEIHAVRVENGMVYEAMEPSRSMRQRRLFGLDGKTADIT